MAARYPDELEFNNYELCPICYGWGKIGKEAKRCFACKGQGQMTRESFRQMRGIIKMIRTGNYGKLRDDQWPRGQALTFARPWLGPPEMVKRAIHTERLYEIDCIIRGGDNRRGWIVDWTAAWDETAARDATIPGQVLNNNDDIVPYLSPKELERFRITQQQKRLEMEEKRAREAQKKAEEGLRRCREAAEAQRKEAEERVKANKITETRRKEAEKDSKARLITPPVSRMLQDEGIPMYTVPPPFMSSYGRGKPKTAPTTGLPTPKEVFMTVTKTDKATKPEDSKFIFLPMPKPTTTESAAQTESENIEAADDVEEVPRAEGTTQIINIHVERLVVGSESQDQPEESQESAETEQPGHRTRLGGIMAMLRRRRIAQEATNIPLPQEPEPVTASPRRRILPRFDFEDSE